MSEIKTTFSGELQLAGWSETHSGGSKVTFWLSSPEDLEAFRVLTVRKGNTAGHRFMAALVEIGDDELPVQPSNEPKPKIGDACMLAVQWCKDPQFWEWANGEQTGAFHTCVNGVDSAKAFICMICGVESRKDIDTNPAALNFWYQDIFKPYRDYQTKQKEKA